MMSTSVDSDLRILVVDDDPIILKMYAAALIGDTSTDFSSLPNAEALVCCENGDTAIKAVTEAIETDSPFSVVFLDLGLKGGESGVDVGTKIRALDPMVNFVIVTGMADTTPEDIAKHIPPLDKLLYIRKPFYASEIRQFASALGAKCRSEKLLLKTKQELEDKVGALKQSQDDLVKHREQLEMVNNQLLETNDALSVLARNLERARKESEKQILYRTRTLILPIIDRLRMAPSLQKYKSDLELLNSYVMNLFPSHTSDMKMSAKLSATESRIAAMIRNGMSTEDIARNMYISANTVKTHRKNIRRKLNIQNSGYNLRAWLEKKS
jgi:DNA-binding NarL/FixJ family response regulator